MSQKRKFEEADRVSAEEPPKKEAKTEEPILRLNTDNFFEIIKHLGVEEALQLEKVSKALHDIVWSNLSAIDIELKEEQVAVFLQSIPKATSIETFSLRIQHPKEIVEINQANSDRLAAFLGSCFRLTDLTFDARYFGATSILSKVNSALKSLHIKGYENQPLNELFVNQRNLISLTLEDWAMHKLVGLESVRNLTSLSLLDTMIDSEGEEIDPMPQIYQTLTNLQHLKLTEFDLYDLKGITQLQNLTSLDLTEVRLDEDEDYKPGFKALAKLPKLAKLNLIGVEGLTTSILKTLNAMTLTELILPDEDPISDEDDDDDDDENDDDDDDGSDDKNGSDGDESGDEEEDDD